MVFIDMQILRVKRQPVKASICFLPFSQITVEGHWGIHDSLVRLHIQISHSWLLIDWGQTINVSRFSVLSCPFPFLGSESFLEANLS